MGCHVFLSVSSIRNKPARYISKCHVNISQWLPAHKWSCWVLFGAASLRRFVGMAPAKIWSTETDHAQLGEKIWNKLGKEMEMEMERKGRKEVIPAISSCLRFFTISWARTKQTVHRRCGANSSICAHLSKSFAGLGWSGTKVHRHQCFLHLSRAFQTSLHFVSSHPNYVLVRTAHQKFLEKLIACWKQLFHPWCHIVRYPEPGYNLFTVRDLLLLCEPTPVRFEDWSGWVSSRVSIGWTCLKWVRHTREDHCLVLLFLASRLS